eukprot:scaffold3065_cov141-Isochrysis_galbana.AAC.2
MSESRAGEKGTESRKIHRSPHTCATKHQQINHRAAVPRYTLAVGGLTRNNLAAADPQPSHSRAATTQLLTLVSSTPHQYTRPTGDPPIFCEIFWSK